MGACCTNEARSKKLDSKEAKLENGQNDDQAVERTHKQEPSSLAATGDDAEFEENAMKVQSSHEQVNVNFNLKK